MIIFIALSAIHAMVFLSLVFFWIKTPQTSRANIRGKSFSIILPVRNESENIEKLLTEIEQQSYSKDLYEVIVIDDNSEDNTAEIVKDFINRGNNQFHYSLLNESGKKAAIEQGIGLAKNKYILATDGDCSVGKNWIASFAEGYEDEQVVMQTGPVKMEGRGLLSLFQSVEFSMLIGFGAAALRSGHPLTCNGANLSYKKEAFLDVKGYNGNRQIPSGDDEFLLSKLHAKYPGSIFFLKNPLAIVTTSSKRDLGELINQRLRWSSKWKFHKNAFTILASVYFFIDYLFYLAYLLLFFLGKTELTPFAATVSIRVACDLFLIISVAHFFSTSRLRAMLVGVALQIIYPAFVSFLGLASIFGKYSWKGRKY
ncbi:MAG: glycosyltransferase [Cyclobacteriaceae bacterium]